jgi:hypothetical protein
MTHRLTMIVVAVNWKEGCGQLQILICYQSYDRDHEGEVHHGPCAFNASETSDKSNLAQTKASTPSGQSTIECPLLYLAKELRPRRRTCQLHQHLLLSLAKCCHECCLAKRPMSYTASQPGTAQHPTAAISITSHSDGGPAGPCKGTHQHTAQHTPSWHKNLCATGIRVAEQAV